MKSNEYYKELKLKSESELHKLLAENREKVRDLRFKASQNQLKEVRKLREAKKAIAQIITILNSLKKSSKEKICEVVSETK